MSTTPLVSDEQIYKRVDGYTLPYRIEITRVAKEFRDIYEAELQAIDAVIHFTAHKLTPSEAVKWLHELYTEQCVTLRECAQRHRIGLGGEKLAKVVADAIDQQASELQSLRQRISRMEEAATNVLNRWDSPNWEWDKHGHTAGLMADLRNALSNK